MRLTHALYVLAALSLGSAASAQTPIKPGTARVGLDSLPLSFGNPFRTAQIPSIYTTSAIFDGLTRIELDGTLQPWLATSWESVDGVTWRFMLREGVTFSNGTPLTAGAVVTAVEYLASEEATRESLTREMPKLKSARAIDERVVEIILAETDTLFPRSAAALPVAEPHEWKRLGREGFSKQPVGTGPYKVVDWQANRVVLTAHDTSWRRPKLRDLEIIAIPDSSARAQALSAGRIDAAVGLAPEALSVIEAEGGQALRIPTAQVFGWAFMLMREGKPVTGPLADARVRRAMTMAVNRQLIVDMLLSGAARVPSQGATPAVYGYNPDLKPLPYDPAAAKKLLAEAGYADGFAMSLMSTAAAVGADTEIHQRVAADLAEVGIRVEIRTTPMQQYLQYLGRSSFPTDAFGMSYPADPNIDAIRPLRIHSCLRREPFYCDERIMPKINAALTATDEAERLKLRRDILAWYAEEAPALFIYEGVRFVGLGPKVRGFAEAHGVIAYDRIDFAD
ncbi:MAG: ABC transporter substrate-binding protein [Rhodospirillaceae bacterium]|nr:ABC transporter substrate-binding protein [Rhodospirillaceae bacterium]